VITFVSSNAQTDGGRVLAAARVLARFGALSEGAILERHVTLGGGECLTVPAVDVRVEAGARVCYSRVQTESEVSSHFSSLSATVARDGVFSSFDASLGGRLSRHELSVRLTGEGAEAAVNGLYLTGGSQHHDHRTSIEHVVGHTTSSQLYKGILAGEARAVFNGRIHITRRAQKSSAAQLCQTLSLSKKAEIDAKPELVIEADDVKASHGATVGQLDPEQLFYFQTRAIGAAAAARALARGFAQDVAFRVPDVPSQDLVARDLDDKLERLIRSSANQLEPAVRA
jgi:Fe-S cluster assembly protein SufD